jgi:DNA-directed RNA polymerase specialized sigma24 family protein
LQQKGAGVPESKENLPQLYRFCFLMLGDAQKAREVFEATLRAATERAGETETPADRFWLFREARGRCLEASEQTLQPEDVDLPQEDLASSAADQVLQIDVNQLAIWISAAPEPQRTALALFYLDEFTHREILKIAELKTAELSQLLASARRQFQSWLNSVVPAEEPT